MSPLRPEDLKHQIEIRRGARASDGKGGRTIAWSPIATPWAEVIGLDGRESVMDQVLQGVSVYRIRIWWREGVQPADQVKYGAIDLNITSAVDPDGKREQLVIMATSAGALKAA